MGLGNLVEERFGVKLAKEHQTSDFGKRPLPPEIRAYVADDVRYLLPLAEQLEAEAAAKGILDELRLEFERIAVECERPEQAPRPKLPQQARTTLGLAVAEAVDVIRHRLAEARNVPVGRVLPNAAVGDIAARLPKLREELSRIPGVKGSLLREAGDAILATIARLVEAHARGQLPAVHGEEGPDRPRPPRSRGPAEELPRRGRQGPGVMPSVVLPTHLVEELCNEPPADLDALARVRWLGEKRLAAYGPAILAALRGDPPPRLP